MSSKLALQAAALIGLSCACDHNPDCPSGYLCTSLSAPDDAAEDPAAPSSLDADPDESAVGAGDAFDSPPGAMDIRDADAGPDAAIGRMDAQPDGAPAAGLDATLAGDAMPEGAAVVPGVVATAIAAGCAHTCALLSDGTVRCWGDNSYGELGNDVPCDSQGRCFPGPSVCFQGPDPPFLPNDCATTPAVVPSLSGVVAISAGNSQTCALLRDGSVQCWGSNEAGTLVLPTLGPSFCSNPVDASVVFVSNCVATPLSVAANVQSLFTGVEHCGLLANGTIQCWGAAGSPPIPADAGTVVSMAEGVGFGCFLFEGGSIQCFGDNSVGQLGDGTMTSSSDLTPTLSSTQLAPFAALALSAGNAYACALLGDGSVECWGDNAVGQLGVGSYGPPFCPYSINPPLSAPCALAATSVKGLGVRPPSRQGKAKRVRSCPTARFNAGVTTALDSLALGSSAPPAAGGDSAPWFPFKCRT
jgi:alpha-tubulin suppressor-like RCC1 family protein